jgi:hypothetical protein
MAVGTTRSRVTEERLRASCMALVTHVQRLAYRWPAPPDAASAREAGAGTCASKHALLADELARLGLVSLPLLIVGRLVPSALAHDPELRDGASLVEVHECLTLLAPWAGPLRVDVTWDPPLVAGGLPATLHWDGCSDMATAVEALGAGWSVPRRGLRAAKEALRSRLYAGGERDRRDRILAALSARFAAWRSRHRPPSS